METQKEVRRCVCGFPQSASIPDAGNFAGYTEDRKKPQDSKEQRV